MNELGKQGLLHFVDVNRLEQPFNLPFNKELKKCEETLRKLK